MAAERLRAAFFSEASSTKPLAAFRIGLAALLVIHAFLLWQYRDLLLLESGAVGWAVNDTVLDPAIARLSWLSGPASAIGLGSSAIVAVVLGLHLVSALALLLGWKTRTAAAVAWITHLLLMHSSYLFRYGVESMFTIGLFYCLFMPVSRDWSLDARGAPAAPVDASHSVLVLRVHMAIAYAAAGISKAVGEQWWSGDAIWRALVLPQFQQVDLSFLLGFPWILQAAALGSIVVQSAYPLLVWTRLRVPIVLLTEVLHLAIAIFLGLWIFSAVMIVFNTGAFGESLWRALRGRARAHVPSASPGALDITVIYDGACPFCSDYVRHQNLRAVASRLALVDARQDPGELERLRISARELDDGMVVVVGESRYDGAMAVHVLSTLSDSPGRWWVAAVALVSRSPVVARALYPLLRFGRRIVLALLGIPRFSSGKAI